MTASVFVVIMSSAIFSPSFAFTSHFDSGGAPLSELSWPSSLAVVAVSFSGLFTFVFLMLACLCCKKGDINFKEFENTEGEEYQADLSTLASPTSQNGPEVYILPLTEVSLPVSKQPGRSIQLLKSADLGRHSLLYLKEIGHGWFGKVLLGEVNAGLSTTQVVVKELKASASLQDQVQFLEEIQPYRALQHPALLQCLAQCTEVTPYLLVMEFCPLGDVKGYLRSCRAADTVTPDPLILQRMACDIASGLLHLHKHNYIHSDLALRNCLLTSEMTVKIGDYGLSHSRYKDDYFVTADQIWVPLRWIAPELIDEVHGNLLVVDQTKVSNVWSLGVTIWELFELGNQPYRHYSDRQVLMYAVKEQQLKLPKPQLKVPLSERWYEVMQFCWLQPEQRPVAEEVHLLLSYLCAKGASEAEEDFEKRWNSLRPSLGTSSSHRAPAVELASSASSSFPLLEHFSTADSFHLEAGDDILTVMETSHGLNFEYKWEQARAEQPYCSSSATGPLGRANPHYQDIYYPISNAAAGSKGVNLTTGVSPSYYESGNHGVVPVLSAHSPSVSSEYYIRIEEPVECNINLEDTNLDYSPGLEAGNSSFSTGEGKSPSEMHSNTYWTAAKGSKSCASESDTSPTMSINMERAHRGESSTSPDQSGEYFSPRDRDRFNCEQSPPDELVRHQQSWVSQCLQHKLSMPENPMVLSDSLSSPSLGCCDPYLEASQGNIVEMNCPNEGYYDTLGPLQKNFLRPHNVAVDVETRDGFLIMQGSASPEDNSDLFSESDTTNWTSNHSANNNSLNFDSRQASGFQDSYLDLHHATPSSHVQSLSARDKTLLHTSRPLSYLEATDNSISSINPSCTNPADCETYIHLCHDNGQEESSPLKCHPTIANPTINHPVSCTAETSSGHKLVKEDTVKLSVEGTVKSTLFLPDMKAPYAQMTKNTGDGSMVLCVKKVCYPEALSEMVSECSGTSDSAVEAGCSSISLAGFDDGSDDDITDITSGIFVDSPVDYAEVGDIGHRSKRRETLDSEDTMNLASSCSPCETLSPDAYHTSILPKSLDSGYDTENNESPEFILKDLEGKPILSASMESDEPEMVLQMDLDEDIDGVVLNPSTNANLQLTSMSDRNQYRDSAYFSDYDTENDKSPCEGVNSFFNHPEKDDIMCHKTEKEGPLRMAGRESYSSENEREEGYHFAVLKDSANKAVVNATQLHPDRNSSDPDPYLSPTEAPGLTMLSPFPPEMGGCLTKESTPDDGLALESEHSVEEPSSECCSSTVAEGSNSTQEAAATEDQPNRSFEGCSPAESLGSDSTLVDFSEGLAKETEDRQDHVDGEEILEFEKKGADESVSEEDGSRTTEDEENTGQTNLSSKDDGSLENILPTFLEDLEMRAPLGDSEEVDEEDSDDSEESDEELRSYNIQEQSEDSDEDFTTVPVVVSDRSGARHLRSLLKMPSVLTQSFCDELEHKKKAVSFFDDVTVFLFDQESPTGELADYSFPSGTEPNGQVSARENHQLQERDSASNYSDENAVEESRALEWENNFPLMPSPSTSEPPSDDITTPPNSPIKSPEDRPAPPFSRFSVSRFSITHVSDSDVDSVGGNSEEGDRV
ncbi:serine/threonine-protein kinase LMTK2 [Chanos chanos]|uniref:non-specific serine/threonine protein kinase n=1 Tax=Chanos chanos TaxID=29144 RepID=A0A6J2WPB0_CHACN|nr:serine/threonine-protein kinase LMTK2-like [Chanos chanos]